MSRRDLPERLPPAEPPKEVGASRKSLIIGTAAGLAVAGLLILSECGAGEEEATSSDQVAVAESTAQAVSQPSQVVEAADSPVAHLDFAPLVDANHLGVVAVLGGVGLYLLHKVRSSK